MRWLLLLIQGRLELEDISKTWMELDIDLSDYAGSEIEL